MSDLDFVTGLELSHDGRLRAFRPETSEAYVEVRRGATLKGTEAPQLADGLPPDLRAAVDAGAIVSFAAGVPADEQADVLFSLQFAQRGADAAHDRLAAPEAWYGKLVEVLGRLGWIGEQFAFTLHDASKGELRMDRSALDILGAIAIGGQLAILVKTLDTLKGLAEGDGAIRIFELQSMAELSGNFQIGAVQRADNGALSMAFGGFRFVTTEARRGVLFWKWGADQVQFWMSAQKMTFNRAHYDQLRAGVEAKLGDEALDYIAEIPIR